MGIFAAFRGRQEQRDLTRERLTETVMAILTRPALRNLFHPPAPDCSAIDYRDVRVSHDSLASLHDRQSPFRA